MTTLLLASAVTSWLVAEGVYRITQPGMLLQVLHKTRSLGRRMPTWLHKPLFGCATCMCSFWSLAVHTWAGVLQDATFAWYASWPFVALAAAGLSSVLFELISSSDAE